MKDHFSREQLDIYINRQIPFYKRILWSLHISKCKRCSDLLKDISKDNEFLSSVKKATLHKENGNIEKEAINSLRKTLGSD